jgi:HD-GYP domain-containing protein (c-di-GMP phosphodiesterase class II)
MPMRKIPIEELRRGMKFSKSLFDKNLNIVLPSGKVLDEMTLKNLKNRNVDFVETAGELLEEREIIVSSPEPVETPAEKKKIVLDRETAKYVDLYKECLNTISVAYNKYKYDQGFDTDKTQSLASKIVNTIVGEKKKEAFINLINIAGKGDYLSNHIINTTILSVLLGQKLGYSVVKLINLAMAALVFDIGMLKVPAYIIEKESKLDNEEYNQVKTHPLYSYQAISRELGLPLEIARVGLEHHERYDGTGYPRKIKGMEMSEMSKIISIIDTYEALTKDRVYREGKDSYDAMKYILGEGSKKLDPEILKVFLNMMSIYPVGCYVQLNNNSVAKVIAADPVSPFRPTVKIMRDEFGDRIEDGSVIRLSKETEVYIVKAMQSKQMKDENAE